MAWYKEALEKGYVVRGEIDTGTNSFPSYDAWQLGKDGNNKVKNEDDCYIQLIGKYRKDKIVCLTGDIKYCRKHNYMMCSSSYGSVMNTLRDYYINNIGDKTDISRIENSDAEERRIWFNDKTIELIIKNTPIESINDWADGEIYLESYDLDFLCNMFNAKKVKKSKYPFHEDNLEWTNKYNIPKNDLDKFSAIYEQLSNGDNIIGAKAIKKANDEFKSRHPRKLSKSNKRMSRIKDFKTLIHYCGYWEEYINYLTNIC